MIVISGITNCIYQKGLNGTYEPVAELSPADMVRYVKRGDNNVWLEYLVGRWQIKPANDKGKVNSKGGLLVGRGSQLQKRLLRIADLSGM